MKKVLFVCLCVGTLYSVKAQTVVDYELVFNETTCLYEAHAHFSGDSRIGLPGTISAPILYSIVIPTSAGANTMITPMAVNPPGSTYTPSMVVDAPAAAPNNTFHSFSLTAPGASVFNDIVIPPGGSVDLVLFTFALPPNTCGTGIRLFINGSDPNSSAPGMGGLDFSQSFQLVDISNPLTASELYNMNLSNDPITTQDPTATPSVTCSSAGIQFTANPTISPCAMSSISYEWRDPSNNVVSTMENPLIPLTNPAAQAGTYTLTVTDANGCSIVETVPLNASDCCDADNGTLQLTID